jgi:hypothetical protein
MWLFGTLGAITVLLVFAHAEFWMQLTFVILDVLAFTAILFAYAYFAKRRPSYLRSERFALIDKALNRDLQGDSLTNLGKVIDIIDPQVSGSADNPKKLGPGQ